MIECVIFDLDGVLTKTSVFHYRAWKRLADQLGIYFDEEINERLKGVGRRESFEIILEKSGKVFSEEEIRECIETKNNYYKELISEMTSKDLFPGVEELLSNLKQSGIKLALASASRNAMDIVDKLDITRYFDCIADVTAVKQGKPAPDLFLQAASRLCIPPKNCLVVEDSAAGLCGARAAGMKRCGIGGGELIEYADLIYENTAEIDLNIFLRGECGRMHEWLICQSELTTESRDFYESIFSLGNGYMGVRGYCEEDVRPAKHEFGTFIAGVFDYFSAGKTDMVNTPNYWKTDVLINGCRISDTQRSILCNENRQLDMRRGVLTRTFVWKNEKGQETEITTTKFLSLQRVHNAAISMRIKPLNYSGRVVIETGIDYDVWNSVIDDDQMKSESNICRLLKKASETTEFDGGCIVKMSTRQSGIKVFEGFCTEFKAAEEGVSEGEFSSESTLFEAKSALTDGYAGYTYSFDALQGQEYTLNKYVSVWTSRDTAQELEPTILEELQRIKSVGLEALLKEQADAWAKKWSISDIVINGDDRCQKALRYNIFQLIQGNSEKDPDVNIGARSVMHGRYKGCYFWDTEIFMLPFYIYTNPNAAKNLLLYRYNTLPGALENARRQNVEGARFPWMSALDGLDQCDTWDIGLSEVHITADVAYAVNQYYEVTGDLEFIRDYGLEILIQTARYWKSRFSYDQTNDCYNMLFVKGPNEYGGVTNNNFYTVKMAVYNMQLAQRHMAMISEKYPDKYVALLEKLGYDSHEAEKWSEISSKIIINYDEEKKLFIEDDNFLKLEPIDIQSQKSGDQAFYKKICFDRLQRYKVLKQADVVLFMLLRSEEFSPQQMRAAWDCYEPITTHDSSLSFGNHSTFASRLSLKEAAYRYFVKSVCLDIENIMENTQKEGIHFGSLGASWQAVVNGFAGLDMVNGKLSVKPELPEEWQRLSFKVNYQSCILGFSIDSQSITVSSQSGSNRVGLLINNSEIYLEAGGEIKLPLFE